MMIKKVCAALLSVVSAAAVQTAQAQRAFPSIPSSLTLERAVSLAVSYNPAHRQVANDRGSAAWGVRNAYAAFLPTFGASMSANYTGEGTQRFLTTEFSSGSSTVGSSYSLGFSWSLSGTSLMQPGVTKSRLDATNAQISSSAINLKSSITQQYLNILQAQAEVELAEVQLNRNQESFRLAQARFNVGQATMLDVRQAEVARGQSEVNLLRERQDVVVEKLRLFQQMGLPAPTDLNSVTLSDTFPILEPEWQLEELLRQADVDNPDVQALQAQESAARWQHRQAKTDWLPTLSFSAGWSGFTQEFTNDDFLIANARANAASNVAACEIQSTIISDVNTRLAPGEQIQLPSCSTFALTAEAEQAIRDNNRVFPFDFSSQPFSARVTVSLPIWDQFSRNLQVSQAAAQADDARESVRSRRLQVRTDVSQAYYSMLTAFQAIGMQQTNRQAAAEQLRLATERYRVGSGTFIELLDAQVAAEQADSDYIRAVYDYHRAIATLESSVGRPLR